MRLLEGLAELLFPTRCACCGRPGELLCPTCAGELPLLEPSSVCSRCAAPLVSSPCPECAGRTFAFALARSAGLLDADLAGCVVVYKDSGETRLAAVLAELAASSAGDWAEWAEAIVPVPSSRGSVARRGFDHTKLLAERLSDAAGVPLISALECRSAADQRGLGRGERRANVRSAFVAVSGVPRKVIVLDDVMTTGATLDAAARALLGAGAREVRALTVARKWTPPPPLRDPGHGLQSATLAMLPPGSVVAGDKP